MKITLTILATCIFRLALLAQENPLFDNLPVGKYAVGFRIVTITDSSRVTKPLYNYFGEKETGDRYQKISIHIWYPASHQGQEKLTYEDYCFNHLLKFTNEKIEDARKADAIKAMRGTFERFFGKIPDEDWQRLATTKMLAQKNAVPVKEKFPLLIGELRPLSTSVTNEMMASNGYVVAMVVSTGGKLPLGYITDVTNLQQAIAFMVNSAMIDENAMGAYGFSGSGFSQVLLTMSDSRVGALADIESALYGEGIFKIFSSSDYYDASRIRVPFLHIYGKYLGMSDTNFDEFFKTKYSQRYHLVLNQPGLHHWDVASEGRASTTVLHTRGELEKGVKASFELSNIYLLHFFNAVLKKITTSKKMLEDRSAIKDYTDTIWTITQYPALQPPPDKLQFVELIERQGIDKGIEIARYYKRVDSTADFIHENALNQIARQLRDQSKPKQGLSLMLLATEFYPDRAWLWLNLSDMQEANGDKSGAINSCERVMELLKDFQGAEQSFNNRIKRSAAASLKRLKES